MIPDEKMLQQRDKEKKMKNLVEEVKSESQTYNRIVSQLVNEHSGDLDDFIEEIDKLLLDLKRGKLKNYSELKLEMKCLMLAHAMYKAADGLSVLGGQSDVAKILREEAFSKVYSKVTEGTIPDKKAEADQQIVTEKMIEGVMQRAYNALAMKVKSGNRLLEAIKKILTSRMINKEIFRKEAALMDSIDVEELTEGDLDDEGGDS